MIVKSEEILRAPFRIPGSVLDRKESPLEISFS